MYWIRYSKNVICVSDAVHLAMPPALKNHRLQDGQMTALQAGPMTAIKWRDHTRDVYLLSTKHDSSMAESGRRTRDDEVVIKPAVVLDYNIHKIGVYLSDQLASYHPFKRRTVKCYKKLFFRLLSVVEVNAYLLYKKV